MLKITREEGCGGEVEVGVDAVGSAMNTTAEQ